MRYSYGNKFFEIQINNVNRRFQFLIDGDSRFTRILLVEDDGSPYAFITTYIEDVPSTYGYLNTNNFPEIGTILEEYGFASNTGITGESGYCSYPLYKFHPEKMEDYISPSSRLAF